MAIRELSSSPQERILLQEEDKSRYSAYFKSYGAEAEKSPDHETLENLAALLGVDTREIRAKVARAERLHREAWKPSRHQRARERAGAVTEYELITEFDGKQLFWQIGADQFLVNVQGRMQFETTLKGALHQLACA